MTTQIWKEKLYTKRTAYTGLHLEFPGSLANVHTNLVPNEIKQTTFISLEVNFNCKLWLVVVNVKLNKQRPLCIENAKVHQCFFETFHRRLFPNKGHRCLFILTVAQSKPNQRCCFYQNLENMDPLKTLPSTLINLSERTKQHLYTAGKKQPHVEFHIALPKWCIFKFQNTFAPNRFMLDSIKHNHPDMETIY